MAPSTNGRRLGARYQLGQPDGSWWELGWDRPLGTLYAHHLATDPHDPLSDEQLVASHGDRPAEHPTVASLAAATGIAIPADIAEQLDQDQRAFPHLADPPYLDFAERFITALDSTRAAGLTNDTDPAPATGADQPAGGRMALPAGPLADTLRRLHHHPYTGGEDLATFATGLGLNPALVTGVLDGQVAGLDVDQIAAVCEALRCSPFDLWGPDLARQILPVYGPERWPRHIEPLDDGRDLPAEDTFIRRRLEQQTADAVTVATSAGVFVILDATPYRVAAVLAVDRHGHVTPVTDPDGPADPDADYHYSFRPLAGPQPVFAPLDAVHFAAGCPPGHDVHPTLGRIADSLDRAGLGADMVRFTEPGSGHQEWIGRQTPFDPWETWDDPRRYYPGDPAEVLNDLADPTELSPAQPPDGVNLDAAMPDIQGVDL